LLLAERTEKTDENLIAAIKRDFLLASDVIGAIAKNLRDDIGGGEHGGAVGNDFRSLIRIKGIDIASLDAGTGLYLDFETRFGENRQNGRHERDPTIARITFFRNTDDHERLPVLAILRIAIKNCSEPPGSQLVLATAEKPCILVEQRGARNALRAKRFI
jgi:hypothetical protein